MQTSNLIKWIVFGFTVTLFFISAITIRYVLIKKLLSPAFKPKVLILLIVLCFCAVLNCWNIVNGFVTYQGRLANILSICTLFIICLFNIHILEVFSILNPNITEFKIRIWKIIVALLFVVMGITQVWTICVLDYSQIPDFVNYYNNFTSTISTVFTILYDNLQGIYLISLVQSRKKHMSDDVRKVMGRVVISLACLSLMDWVGFLIFAAAIFIPAIAQDETLYCSIITFAETYIGIHALGMIFVFKQLTEFLFVDKKPTKDKPKKKLGSGAITFFKS
ncbi:hypothetical protein HDV04_001625 [Boothiomyces sp. JEL0838]|nr:hypothetical protein HDV04_001625 [Boothiomyces sp. JEL0838]